MKFKKNLLSQAAAILFVGFIGVSSSIAAPAKHTMANKDDCIVADKSCLLQVTPTTTHHGNRSFDVMQLCDTKNAQTLYLYKLPMEEQITQRKFLGRKLCNGVVSTSNMDLPFSKGVSALDANDGLLLIDTAEDGIKDILSLISNMNKLARQAASGDYSSTQLSNLNAEFSDYLSEANRVASVTTFNGITLLDGASDTIEVLINKGKKHVSIRLANMTTGISGLHISGADISSVDDAKSALQSLSEASKRIKPVIKNLEMTKPRFDDGIKLDAIVTSVDLNEDVFVVTHEGYTQ